MRRPELGWTLVPRDRTGRDEGAVIAAGPARPDAQGLDIEWIEADAEHLPFDDGSYDVVMSAIRVMLAPHQRAAADELVRVASRGAPLPC